MSWIITILGSLTDIFLSFCSNCGGLQPAHYSQRVDAIFCIVLAFWMNSVILCQCVWPTILSRSPFHYCVAYSGYIEQQLLKCSFWIPFPMDLLSLTTDYFLAKDCLSRIRRLIMPCGKFLSLSVCLCGPSAPIFCTPNRHAMLWKSFIAKNCFLRDSLLDFVTTANSFVPLATMASTLFTAL